MKNYMTIILALLLVFSFVGSALAAEVKPEGRIFAHYMYNLSGYPDWDERYGNNDYNEFAMSRAYLGFKAAFNDQWSARITADITRIDEVEGVDADGNVITADGLYNYYLKYAYGNFAPYEFFAIRFGQCQTAWIDMYSGVWGYRYVAKTPSDLWKLDTSSDLGVAIHGDFPGGYGNYYAMLRNGEGYKHPEVNKGKAFQVRLALTPLQMNDYTRGLMIAGAYMMDNDNPSDPDIDTTLVDLMIAYNAMFGGGWGINLGGAYFMRTVATDVDGADDINSTVINGFGTLYMPYHLALFGRYDMFDPDTENDEDTHGYQDEQSLLIVGISFDPIKNIKLALDYQTTMYTAEVMDDEGEEVTKPSDSFLFIHTMLKF